MEHRRFVEAVKIHGKNDKEISKVVGTRDKKQCKAHIYQFLKYPCP